MYQFCKTHLRVMISTMKLTLLAFILLFQTKLVGQTDSKDKKSIFPVFNYSQLGPFTPGKLVSNIPNSIEQSNEEIVMEKALSVKKFYLSHEMYKFPVWVQYFNDKILDFYIRLPSYFLHDTFHQSLINRYGKQKKYTLRDSTAVFEWDNNEFTRVYSGGCTITCFPIYYAVITKNRNQAPSTYIPLVDQFLVQAI